MIRRFSSKGGRLESIQSSEVNAQNLVWIDLVAPSVEEGDQIERELGIAIPTRDEMEEIEISSRLYHQEGAAFMTAILPANADGDDPDMQPVSFILSDQQLITVRYHEPRAFETFLLKAQKTPMGCDTAQGVLVALLEAIVDRLADILERAGGDVDQISRQVFRRPSNMSSEIRDFQGTLETIGRKGDLTSNIRNSLVTLDRLAGFLAQRTSGHDNPFGHRERVKTLSRDVRSIADHANFLSQKITFLLDATLGMISIEQNAIIKIFSVAAVVFLPPTLIASIYGMNFDHMPELGWSLGYPAAIGLMILSAIMPYLFFKRRGWL